MSSEKESGILTLFQKIFGSLLGISGGDREKKKLLKDIKKELKRTGRFYRVGSDSAQPAMAKFFHDIYHIVGPVYALISPYVSSDVLKLAFIQMGLNETEKDLDEKLGEVSLRERSKVVDLKVLREEVKQDLIKMYGIYDRNRINVINHLYNSFLSFMDFAGFDYYFTLKKFDSALPEGDFNYLPKFESLNGEYIIEDLKDFLSVLEPIDLKVNWGAIFEVLKEYRDLEVIKPGDWKKLLKSCDDVRKSRVFELIVKHLDEDPYYQTPRFGHGEEIVETYLENKKKEVERVLIALSNERRIGQIEAQVKTVFGTTAISRTQNYTLKANINFTKKGANGFNHVDGINYLKAFYLDTYKSRVRSLVDILLIEGKWTTNLTSQQFSEIYHQLLEYADQVVAFDNDLAEDAPIGSRLKRYLRMANLQDQASINNLNLLMDETNAQALDLIKRSSAGFISLGKMLKQLIEDYKVVNHQVIINWKELDSRSDNHIEGLMTEIYKIIYHFVQLLQYSLKK